MSIGTINKVDSVHMAAAVSNMEVLRSAITISLTIVNALLTAVFTVVDK